MANNRMWIVCEVCGEYKRIGKYYPSTGWYFICSIPEGVVPLSLKSEESIEALNNWFDEHLHEGKNTFEGPEHFRLEFRMCAPVKGDKEE